MMTKDVEMYATVRIVVGDREAIQRVTGPGGDDWRAALYPLHTEQDVLNHWAYNALANGVVDACQLDGWADLEAETVTMHVEHVETSSS